MRGRPVDEPCSLSRFTHHVSRFTHHVSRFTFHLSLAGAAVINEAMKLIFMGTPEFAVPSLLPKYRGAAPINWAIANGEPETGVTIMQMDAGMDTGPMLTRRALAIGDMETAPELATRLAELGAALLSDTLPKIERGEITAEAQNHDEATYAP